MEPAPTFTGALQGTLEEAREQAREQLVSAWQLYVSRVEEQLRTGWEDNIAHLLDQRFQELTQRLSGEVQASMEERLRTEVDRVRAEEKKSAGRRITEILNVAARRLRQATKQEEWSSALIDAAGNFAPRAAVFTVQGQRLRLDRSTPALETLEIDMADAPALAQTVREQEPVVAVRNAKEISLPLADALGSPAGPRVFSFPIENAGKCVALLFAEGAQETVDVNALEALASVASLVWQARVRQVTSTAQPAAQPAAAAAVAGVGTNGLIAIQAATQGVPAAQGALVAASRPSWAELPANEQDLHLKAQRFARVQVAEIRLFKSQAVKEGRQARALYATLRDDIERGREAYRRQFVGACPSMVDYLHLEMVRTLANDNEELLGAEYPGPLA